MLAEIAQTVDEVVIINRGRRIASGRIDELTRGGKTLEDTYLELTTARESS
jgi:ABC-2 type transport system ATP-binding protein